MADSRSNKARGSASTGREELSARALARKIIRAAGPAFGYPAPVDDQAFSASVSAAEDRITAALEEMNSFLAKKIKRALYPVFQVPGRSNQVRVSLTGEAVRTREPLMPATLHTPDPDESRAPLAEDCRLDRLSQAQDEMRQDIAAMNAKLDRCAKLLEEVLERTAE